MINCMKTVEKELNKVEKYMTNLLQQSSPLQPAYKHLLQCRGKYLRSALFVLSGNLTRNYDSAKFIPVAAALEILHLATLLHDDVIDNGQIRRGKISLNSFLGNKIAILSGDSLFAQAFLIFAQQNNQMLVQTMAELVSIICRGETEEIFNSYNIEQKERAYMKIIGQKTASFFAASCYLGGLLAGSEEKMRNALRSCGYNLGLAFQISDDFLDLVGLEKDIGKTLGNDLQEGIMNLPIIYALENSLYKEELAALIEKKQISGKNFALAVEIIRQSGALSYCYEKCQNYLQKSINDLQLFSDSYYKADLYRIIDYIDKRFLHTDDLAINP